MKRITIGQATRSLAHYAAELDDEIVVVTRRNRPVAALVPLRNVDRESLTLSSHPEFLKLVQRARHEIAAGRTLSLQEMRDRVLPRRPPSRRLQPAAPRRRGG